MLTRSRFLALQENYYTQVCSGNSFITVIFPKITPISSFTNFTGDSDRDLQTNKLKLHCLYHKSISDNERSKYGIAKEVKSRVYISPLELQKLTGSQKFDDSIMAAPNLILCDFQGEQFEVFQLIEQESQVYGDEQISLAIELRLKDKK